MRWEYEDYEIKAIILDAVEKGIERNGKSLSPTEGHMIANFVIGLMDGGNQIDLRSFFDHAIPSYLHWRHEHGVDQIQDKLRRWGRDIPSQVVHWQDVVRSKLAGQAQVESREQRLQRERRIACQCYKDGSDTNERLKLWEERTSHRKQAFYDRLGEPE